MPIPPYTPGNPQSGQTLGNSRAIIQQNLDGTQQTLAVDHQGTNLATPGYHNVIHMTQQPAPSQINGIAQLWSQQTADGFVTDEIFHWLSGGNKNFQFTRNFQPASSTGSNPSQPTRWSGVIPGVGVIVQGGSVNITPSGTVQIALNPNFPFAFYTVIGSFVTSQSLNTSGLNFRISRANFPPTVSAPYTSFGVTFGSGFASDNLDTFCWIAVGN